jgi:hypothetical protein
VLGLRAGDRVEVRSRSEILATLDGNGCLDGLPFMPEMLAFAGRELRVYKRADKTCDTVNKTGSRRMMDAVHLDGLRCDGSAHGGCQAGCLLFWKEAWLKRPGADPGAEASGAGVMNVGCSEIDLECAASRQDESTGETLYSCQATALPAATSPLPWWDFRQYVRDLRSGNFSLPVIAAGGARAIFNTVMRTVRRAVMALGQLVPSWMDGAATVPGGASASPQPGVPARREGVIERLKAAIDAHLVEWPHVRGTLHSTPAERLDLRPGELVQVKSREEILATLDTSNRNRGLLFDVEMLPFCGGTYRVLQRVERIVNERTGRMMHLKNDCIILEGVACRGCLSRHRMFCPRSIYSYWREIWLRRVE